MPDKTENRQTHPTTFRAVFAPDTWNADARTVDVVWSTGAPVARQDWWTDRKWTEVLDMSSKACDLGRMNTGAPVLNTHSSWSVSDVIGVIVDGSARITANEGRATVRFSNRADVQPIVEDVANGILRNLSVGYVVDEWNVQEATATAGEIRTAKRWTPYEISFVPIPADAGAQVRADPPHGDNSQPAARAAATQEPAMPDDTKATDTIDRAAIEADARAAEQARASGILLIAEQAGQTADWARNHIVAGNAVDAVRKDALDAVAAATVKRVNPATQMIRDEGDTTRALLANAFESYAGVRGAELQEGARQFRGGRLIDFARSCIEMSGGRARGLTPMETYKEAFRLGRVNRMQTRAGEHTTSDFPDLLANVAGKTLRDGYVAAPRTFLEWTTKTNLPNFKSFKTIALSGISQLAAIAESGEVTYGTFGDSAETWSLLRYGRAVSISYVAMVNDDLSGFTRVPQMFGAAASRLESNLIYGVSGTGILATNAAMVDGTALFHSDHGNTATGVLSADATGIASVGAAQLKLRVQTAPSPDGGVTTGDILNLQGRFLIVPAALETKAMSLFSPTIVPATAAAVNTHVGSIKVISEPRLDATSAVAFYLMADPNSIDTIHWGYLDGENGPVLSSEIDFDTDGMKTKVMHSFGAKAIDWRGMVYSSGA